MKTTSMPPAARRAGEKAFCEVLSEIYPGTTWVVVRPAGRVEADAASEGERAMEPRCYAEGGSA